MTFTFRGSRAELAQRIEAAAKAEGRDIYIGDTYPDRMEIGFERHGHQGGRFFYAAITEAEGVLTLTGEAEDSHRHRMSGGQRLWDSLSGWLAGRIRADGLLRCDAVGGGGGSGHLSAPLLDRAADPHGLASEPHPPFPERTAENRR